MEAPPRSKRDPSPKRIVREGWNRLSRVYRPPDTSTDVFAHTESEYRKWLEPLIEALPDGAEVLDLGCGTGIPASRALARRFHVTGVDLSDVMVRRARMLVPRARFLRADMTAVDFPPGTFAAIVCLYSIIHVPLAEQRPLFERIHRWLAPGGLFLTIVGHRAWEGIARRWLDTDTRMFWSHTDAATYRAWLRAIGFSVLRQQLIPEAGSPGHELFLVRKHRRVRQPLSR